MKKKIYDTLKVAAVAAFFIAAFGLAGHSDYVDNKVAQMKNDGSYWELSEKYPQASDGELVEMYEAEQALGDESEQCPD